MVQKEKKLPRVFDYFVEKDQFAGGNTFCAGCPAELTLRTIPKVLGKDVIMVGIFLLFRSCAAWTKPRAWHHVAYYACVMTGVASSASGISRYLPQDRQRCNDLLFTGDGDASRCRFPTPERRCRKKRTYHVCLL